MSDIDSTVPPMALSRRSADTLFNDLWLPGETRAIRAEARAFAEDVVRPVAHALNTQPEQRDGFPRAIFDAMARAGLYRIPFGRDVGGRGLEFPTLATLTVLEEIGYFSPGLASALYDGQAILSGKTLDQAPEPVRSRFLPLIVKGESVCAFATSEPDASTDLSAASMQTVATPVEGGYRISGCKRWITNSVAADWMLTLCRLEDRLTMFMVDMRADGIHIGDPDLKMGNHAQLTADVSLDRVFVPSDRVVGSPGGGLRVALGALMLGRMGIGAIGVAMAQRAFDFATHYMRHRQVFGRPLAGFQHWQFSFADHAIGIENARNLYQKAAMLYDRTGQPETEAAMAKIVGSELPVNVVRDAIQVCGGYGFVRELKGSGECFPLEAIYRDAKIGEIYEGANEVQRWVIARKIFGREFTG